MRAGPGYLRPELRRDGIGDKGSPTTRLGPFAGGAREALLLLAEGPPLCFRRRCPKEMTHQVLSGALQQVPQVLLKSVPISRQEPGRTVTHRARIMQDLNTERKV